MVKYVAAMLLACAALAVPAVAADPDATKGPKRGTCVDIDSGVGGVVAQTLTVVAKVLGTGCPANAKLYRLDVYDAAGTALLASTTDATKLEDATGDQFVFSVPVSVTTVCIVVTTGGGAQAFDRAPDAGAGATPADCIPIAASSGGGLVGFH